MVPISWLTVRITGVSKSKAFLNTMCNLNWILGETEDFGGKTGKC